MWDWAHTAGVWAGERRGVRRRGAMVATSPYQSHPANPLTHASPLSVFHTINVLVYSHFEPVLTSEIVISFIANYNDKLLVRYICLAGIILI